MVSVSASDGSLVLDRNMTASIAAKGDSVLTRGEALLTLEVPDSAVVGWWGATRYNHHRTVLLQPSCCNPSCTASSNACP